MDAPPPARVPWNRWSELSPPPLGEWTPTRPLTVILGGAAAGPLLAAPALCEQSYPRSLVEVLLIGEPPAPNAELAETMNELGATSVDTADRAVEVAGGEILVFLDAGSVPARRALEAHARWHHVVSDAVVLGTRPRVLAEVDALELKEAVGGDRLAELFEGRTQRADPWLERHLDETDDLSQDRLDLFTVGLADNFSLRAETLASVGGYPAPSATDPHGLEPAYRLATFGALLVPERQAPAWQVGDDLTGAAVTAADADAVEAAPDLASRAPLAGLRGGGGGRIFATPTIAVTMAVEKEPAHAVAEAIDTALAGSFNDLRITVELDPGYAQRELLERAFAADPRVAIADSDHRTLVESPFQAVLPPAAVPDQMTFRDIHDVMTEEPLGALYVTVPGRSADEAIVRVVLSGALARARRLAAHGGGDEEALIGELFGERWISGVEVGVHDPAHPKPRLADQGPLATMPEIVRERARADREKARAGRERVGAQQERVGARTARERLDEEKARADEEKARAAQAKAEAAEERTAHQKAAKRVQAIEQSSSYRLARLLSRSKAAVGGRVRPRRSR